MEEHKLKIIGITNLMELHVHGVTEKEEWYTNISISKIMDILEQYTYDIGAEKERAMLEHLATYFYDKIGEYSEEIEIK